MTYDYIIVGAGSAGCVLADRLTRDSKLSVLLIEAGPSDNHPLVRMPRGYGKLFTMPTYNWYYQTEDDGTNPGETWLRGKMLGGSSSTNGMLYVRGQPEDYDGWVKLGNPGWDWSEISRIFRSMEDHELGDDGVRGTGGPLRVSITPSRTLTRAFIDAGVSMGLPRRDDLNRPSQEGIGMVATTIWRGTRQSAATAFLKQARQRANLRVATDTRISHLGFNGNHAHQVHGIARGQPVSYEAKREIIVCSGAIESPALLQRSGIGPAMHLQSLGIKVVHNSPGVGHNLREHRLLLTQYRINQPLSVNHEFSGWGLVKNALKYQFAKTGPLSGPSFDTSAFIKTLPTLDRPDAQIAMAPFSLDLTAMKLAFEQEHGLVCFSYVLRPESQGTILLRSRDMDTPPAIRPNYLTADYDRQVTTRMFRYQRRLCEQPALAKYITAETRPGAAVNSDDEIIDAFRRMGTMGYHAVGTCHMGPDHDATAVLDSRLRVRGVSGLRVVDCSAMPTMPSGNTNAPVMAMAWRAAELIIEDQNA